MWLYFWNTRKFECSKYTRKTSWKLLSLRWNLLTIQGKLDWKFFPDNDTGRQAAVLKIFIILKWVRIFWSDNPGLDLDLWKDFIILVGGGGGSLNPNRPLLAVVEIKAGQPVHKFTTPWRWKWKQNFQWDKVDFTRFPPPLPTQNILHQKVWLVRREEVQMICTH